MRPENKKENQEGRGGRGTFYINTTTKQVARTVAQWIVGKEWIMDTHLS